MKNFLIKIASKIINKYGVFELEAYSRIKFHKSTYIVTDCEMSVDFGKSGRLLIGCDDITDRLK